jgi:hypothetical protein
MFLPTFSLSAPFSPFLGFLELRWDVLTIRSIKDKEGDSPNEPSDELLSTHKSLMDLLLQYEHLTKRISSVQCVEGGNQATVQGAVARTAAAFLTREMLKVQVSTSSYLHWSQLYPNQL